MKTSRSFRIFVLTLAIITLVLTQLACGSSTAQKLASAVPPTAAPKQDATSAPEPAQTQETEPTFIPSLKDPQHVRGH